MKARILAPLIALIILSVFNNPAAAAPLNITPDIHRDKGGGYFRVQLTLPKEAPKEPLALNCKIDEGGLYLVNAFIDQQYQQPRNMTDPAAERTVTVTGRYAKGGKARITILGRPSGQPFKPLAAIAMQLPRDDVNRPEVRTAWARHLQMSLTGADPYSEDSFSHYWNLAIAPQYGLTPELRDASNRFRREPPDLYSIFTGAAAIQESLQLELLGTGPQNVSQRESIRKAGSAQTAAVSLNSLQGPTVKSHPFKEMLKGKNPPLPQLANYIPEDQYAVFFSDITKQFELADLLDEWGGNMLRQVESSSRDFHLREKLTRQLCLESSLLSRWFGDRVVGEMAFTGSDPFLKEGTAFTVLFSLKDGDRFRKQLEKRYSEAVAKGGQRTEFTIAGQRGVGVVSPDRRISSYLLILGKVAVVSNSKPALERIVACLDRKITALAQAEDFRYMRTIFTQGDAEEDIFIYLSDPHIRNLVSPRWKIGEARRMRCAANMGLIANARLWFSIDQRREPVMEELQKGGYLGPNLPTCPDHGVYGIGKNGEPYCSKHNRVGHLTPVGETGFTEVTAEEAAQYKAFVENYNRYWTQFFDPIGIRVKMGNTIRVQTCILPLIENSWYDGLAAMTNRTSGSMMETSLLPRTVFSLRGRLAPDWLEKTDIVRHLNERNPLDLEWLGNDLSLNLCDGPVLFSAGGRAMGMLGQEMGRSSSLEPLIIGYLASALNLPTYLTVKVKDPARAEQSIPSLFRALWPEYGHSGDDFSMETYSLDEYRGKPLYVANFTLWIVKLRLFAAVVDDQLVVASRRDVLTDLIDVSRTDQNRKVTAKEGSAELTVYRSAFKELAESVSLGWQEELRHSCQKNLPLAAIMLKTLEVDAENLSTKITAQRGYEPYCPSGGRYQRDKETGAITCSIHGNRFKPRQPSAADQQSTTMKLVNSLEKVNARLAFTPEGLMTTVEIKRK
jgi:hypothetical protein